MHDFIFIKSGAYYIQVLFSDILYFESKDKYTYLITGRNKYLILQSLNSVERILPSHLFCRIHRSYIVSFLHIKQFNNNTVFISDKKLTIGKQYRGILQSRVLTFSNKPKQHIILSDYDLLKIFKKINLN